MINKYSIIQKSRELKLLLNTSAGRILMFHVVDDKQNWEYEDFSITFESFKLLIEALLDKYYKFNPIHDIYSKNQISSKSVYLTFDDGYACLNKFVIHYLIDKNIPFAIFPIIDFLKNPIFLNCEQLRRLSENKLCTIGAHTISHPMLRSLKDKESKIEISNAKSMLEKIISKEVDYFAYPYGSVYAVSARDIYYAMETGYKLAFSSISGPLDKNSIKERYFLPRINVNESNYYTISKG